MGNASAADDDAALTTLMHPFATGALTWPEAGSIVFLRARCGDALVDAPRGRFVCQQDFKPCVDELLRWGMALDETGTCASRLVLLLAPRQRDEARAALAQAITRTRKNGIIVACARNNEGARSHEADLRRLCGRVHSLCKHHCRVFWAEVDEAAVDQALLREWAALEAPRPIADGRFISRPGLFAWDRIDTASELLASHLPTDLSGNAADLGAGFGYLSIQLLGRCAGVKCIDVYEADARALDLARENIARANAQRATPARLEFFWHDVTAGLRGGYDVIVSNPPFHVDRLDQPALGRAFIAAAADALRPGGRFWMVANRHLPYEAVLGERYASVRCVASAHGFKIIEAIKGA